MQITRGGVPDRAEMFRIPAAEILRGSDVLWRCKRLEKIICFRAVERSLAVDGHLADYAGLVDVVVLERVVENAVAEGVAIVVAIGATRAALGNFAGEDLPAALNFLRFGLRRHLGQRIGEQTRFILRPENLEIRHVVIPDLERLAVELRPVDGA